MAQRVWIKEIIDLRPTDFDSGRKLALPVGHGAICQCCGQEIVKVAKMSNGAALGVDCGKAVQRYTQVVSMFPDQRGSALAMEGAKVRRYLEETHV